MKNNLKPTFNEENSFMAQGYRLVAGVDEVGCGAMAGPVVAAAVILPSPLDTPWLTQVRDSKQLTPAKRERLSQDISKIAISSGIGMASHEVIDSQGLTRARLLAMKLAIDQLSPAPHSLLIDYISIPALKLPQKSIKYGDSLCFSIACASIIAKVARDNLMLKMDGIYPGYGLANHKGYCTKMHLSCLQRLGPSPIHRQSFKPVKDVSYETKRGRHPG